MSRISGAVALLALALGLPLLAPPASGAPAVVAAGRVVSSAAAPAVPVISWGRCEDLDGQRGSTVQCATVAVPLDYDDPTGPTLDLDLLRVRAGHPEERIGTLFVNPGGPGGESRFFALGFGHGVPAEVSRRFDVVGIDPRGVGPSSIATCRTGDRPPPYPQTPYPTNARQVRRQIAFDDWQREACREHPRPVIDHMTTADTARDMDLVRQAVGDPALTYYGISYGTQLGTTYAAMFPGNVRAMVLDGVLDPVAWSTGSGDDTDLPFSTRVGSGRGSWLALTHALADCDDAGPRGCPIAGHARATWRDIVRRLDRRPFHGLTHASLVAESIGMLYDPRGIRVLMRQLGELHAALFEGGRLPRLGVRRDRAGTAPGRGRSPGPYAAAPTGPAATGYGKTYNGFAGVACADSDNPSDPRAWVAAAQQADRRAPGFGASWTWASSVCAGWPESTKEDRFTGPYDVTPSAPVLVVGNTHDPATPIPGARAVHSLLGGSRLLTLDGYGHGAIGSGPCIGRAYADYLVRGALPAEGTVCQPRRPLFPKR